MPITRIVVLLKLKPGSSRPDYEAWARSVDLPNVNRLQSVQGFEVFEATGLLGSSDSPPYDYIEVLDVADMARFGQDVASATMQAIAAEFQRWADPVFVTTRRLDWEPR
jgi:hypothetical protein